MKLETKSEHGQFGSIQEGQPFYLIRRDCWGIKISRNSGNASVPNAVLLFSDGGLGTENLDGREKVIPAKEVHIRIE